VEISKGGRTSVDHKRPRRPSTVTLVDKEQIYERIRDNRETITVTTASERSTSNALESLATT
jgi:hypothetical protein